MNQKGMMGWLYSEIGDKKPSFIFSIIFALLEAVSGFIPFVMVAAIVTKLIEGVRDLGVYGLYVGLMALFYLLRVTFHAISTTFSHVATFAVLSNIRTNCLDKLARMQLGDVMMRNTGTLKNIIVERVDAIEPTLAHMVPDIIANLFVPFGILILLFIVDWRMALASLITIPIGLLSYALMMNVSNKGGYFAKSVKATQNLNDATVEYINGMEVIKVFGKTESSYKKFEEACNNGANAYIGWMKKANLYMNFAIAIFPATMLGILPVGAYFLIGGSISMATLITVIILALSLVQPLITVMSYSDDIMAMGQTIAEVRSILDADEMVRPESIAPGNEPKDASITLENVHFAYQEKEVLHGIDIDIKSGEYVALVGPSGSGKSTIAKLIAGMWDVKDGAIKVGGVDVRELPLNYYQDMIAYVSQDNYLFNDTVMNNIRIGKKNGVATDAEVIDVAKRSGCHDFIMSLERGYDTVVGSAGGHLSGGERQRISIARAMLSDADIVILDEATAYTDPENEAVIQDSVARLVENKTLIVIAHRLSTITSADKIICIEDGRVVEAGKHDELLANGALYSKMWTAHMSVKDTKEGI